MPTIKFGAIRWAWRYAQDPNASAAAQMADVGGQVRNALWASNWQSRAPVTSTQRNAEVLTIPATQASMEAEITTAAASNLSYWAYLRYATGNSMERALAYHKTASNKSSMKWCGIEGVVTVPASYTSAIARIVAEMALPEYMTVLSGRPLLYFYDDATTIAATYGSLVAGKTMFDALRSAATGAGLGNPYIVGMIGTDGTTKTALGYDATSAYAPATTATLDEAYPALDTACRANWAAWAAGASKIVPCCTAGWNRGPRFQRPESYTNAHTTGGALRSYGWRPYMAMRTNTTEATQSQFQAHISAAIAYVQANPTICDASALLCYAWDENSEGGYLCPTLGNTGGKIGWVSSILGAA
jgi:hypothetical protein